MAITTALIFTGITIEDAGGGSPETYDKNIVDEATVTLTPATSMVEDGQTFTDYYDVEYQVDMYDDGPLSDARVYSDASEDAIRAMIKFNGATGATDLTIDQNYINATKVFDGQRWKVRVFGSKRGVQIDSMIVVANAT
jgi:hypothetical protein